jgi:hypothetical protein
MEYEIHEQILLHLYELRNSDEYSDLLIQFKDISSQVLNDRVEELRTKDLIDVQYPFQGGFIMEYGSGRTTNIIGGQRYLKAKIKADGIDYVKDKILLTVSDDEIINKILDIMSDREQHSVQGQIAVYFHLVDNTHYRIRERMIRKRLIKSYTKDGEIITDFGMDVIDKGGWIKFKEAEQNITADTKGTIINVTADIGAIQKNYGTIHGAMSQSIVSSNKSTSRPTPTASKSINIKKIIKNIVWILSAIVTIYGIYE